jgi:uncharacterized damage-inducible protein DinB
MAEELVARFQRWFEYEKDAHAKVIRSLETVPADRRSSSEYRRAVEMLGHMVAARRVWLSRLRGKAPSWEVGIQLPAVITEWQEVQRGWTEYFAQLTESDMVRSFEYQSSDAGRFRNRIEDILAQLFGHSWYHRGQIAMLIRAAGGEPAATDLVFWCREPVSG